MKVLYDTNVLLDVLLRRPPFYTASAQAWTLAEVGRLEGMAAAPSFTNIFYIVRKGLGREFAANAIKKMCGIFTPAVCDAWVINHAIDGELPDFEDAVQDLCALRAGADCIVTRNTADFPSRPAVPVFTPREFLTRIETP